MSGDPWSDYLARRAKIYAAWLEAIDRRDVAAARELRREIGLMDEPWQDPGPAPILPT